MKLYIARDSDGSLALFKKKPKIRIEEEYGKFWVGACLRICTNEYPEVTFENSPMEVELVLKKLDVLKNSDMTYGTNEYEYIHSFYW